MKGLHAVIVAVGLGLTGAIVNWLYLSTEAQKIEKVAFIGIKPGIVIGRSELLKGDKLVPVEIPANTVGNLLQFAFKWDERGTVIGQPTWRTIDSATNGGSLLFRSDVLSPPAELGLGKDETAQAVPIDTKLVVMSLIRPNTMISFRVPTAPSLLMPTPAHAAVTSPSPAPTTQPAGASTADGTSSGTAASTSPEADLQPQPEKSNAITSETSEIIGPFKVLSVGNRMADSEVMRGAKVPQLQENILEIRVSKDVVGEPERFEHLWQRLQAVGFHGVSVIITGKKE